MEAKYTRIKPISWKQEMKTENNEKHYPTLSLSIRDIPEIKDWKVGETYNVALELKQVSMSQHKEGGGASFEILGYRIEDDEDYEDEDDEDESDDDEESEDDEDED